MFKIRQSVLLFNNSLAHPYMMYPTDKKFTKINKSDFLLPFQGINTLQRIKRKTSADSKRKL